MSSLDLSLVTGHETIGADAANSGGTTVAASASTNTKGSWVELAASTAAEASWIEVVIASNSAGARYLIDIGIGAAASEVVLLANLHFENATAGNSGASYRFPVAIAAGSRVSARIQCSTGSATIRMHAILGTGDPGSLSAPGSVATYGADTSDSGLTQIDPGGSAGTDSAWVQLTASTSADIRWLVLSVAHNAAATTTTFIRWLIDIGTGGSGSETVVVADIGALSGPGEDSPNPRTVAFPIHLAAGTRIAVRARCSGTNATDRLLDVAVYGADASVPAGGGGSQHAHAAWSG